MQEETRFATRVDKELRNIPDCWFFNVQAVVIRGIPDRIGCINGNFFALELKKDSKAPVAKLQMYVINKIREAGGFAELIYPENFTVMMEQLKKYGHH